MASIAFSSPGEANSIVGQKLPLCLSVCVLTRAAHIITAAHRDLKSFMEIQSLASCLIDAHLHSPFRHTALPQTTTRWLAAQGHDLTDDWSLASAHFVDSLCPFRCSSGCVL